MIGHWINGRERFSRSNETFESIDPWTQKVHKTCALAGSEEVTEALAGARAASHTWAELGFDKRATLLGELAALIENHATGLALSDTHDMGRPVSDVVRSDIPRAVDHFRFFADHARLAAGETFPRDSGHVIYTRHEPAGVVAAIAPWNFPLMLATWKVAPALAWGNTVVLKPAEHSPCSAALLGRLATEAGIPDGVLNVVQGFGAAGAGEFLVASAEVDRITFTGESATGKAISAAAANNLVPVSLELGGKAASLVFDDCLLDEAVRWTAAAAFANAGQICLAGSRILVARGIYPEFVDRFVAAAEALSVGDPTDPRTQIGPLGSEEHFQKVAGYLARLDSRTRICTGGPADDGSWVVEPTVLVEVEPEDAVCREEVFGPVAAILPFDSETEAVDLANATPFGLNALLFTEGGRRAQRVSSQLRVGTVWVNCFNVRDSRSPFGGTGESGIGREGGHYSRDFFTEPKTVVLEP
jgi:aminomuconate-semialdehyde/2-hydroxymuconate-6-semialdehyde dehydrogenase